MAVRITIKDIARELNIHHSTVSRALRNDSRVKEETRKSIMAYAQKHGYKVNMSALQLLGSVRNIIALMVPNIRHYFFSNMVSHIANYAKEDGYIVSVFQSNENLEEEKEIINNLIQHNVAGVIASISLQTRCGEHFNELGKFDIPLVFFDRVCDDISAPKVTVNNREIVKKAVDELAQKGYKKIAHITGTDKLNVFNERQMGYKDGLLANNLQYAKIISIDREFTTQDGEAAISELIEAGQMPDALIIDSHNLTMGVYMELNNRGLKIPKDIAIIGYGDNPAVEVIQPRISTIVQPEEAIAKMAYDLLKEQIDTEGKAVSKKIEVESEIVMRESC